MTIAGSYVDGTASVANGSTTVSGQGTAWAMNTIRAGDLFHAQGLSVPIAAIVSNTELTLEYGWPGTELAEDAYRVLFTADSSRNLAATIETRRQLNVLDANGRGLFYNLIGVTGDNDPGPGNLAFDAEAPEEVTEAYLDVLDANAGGGLSVAGIIDLWSSATVIVVRSIETSAYAAFRLGAGPDTPSGYRRLSLEYIDHDGTLGNEPVAVEWNRGGEDLRIDRAGSFAGRDAFDDVDPDDFGGSFVYAATDGADGGGGPTVLYLKNSATSGDWSPPIDFQGPVGPPPSIQIGTVTTVNPGTPASVTLTGTAPNYTLDYDIPKGSVVTFGSVTTLGPGQLASAAITPTAEGFRIDLSIPRGDTGDINGVTAFWQERITQDDDFLETMTALGLTASQRINPSVYFNRVGGDFGETTVASTVPIENSPRFIVDLARGNGAAHDFGVES